MKEDEVPQEDENKLYEGKNRLLEYAVDKDGNYTQKHSVGFEPKNVALEQAWELIDDKVAATKKKVLAGELSTLAYHMEKNLMKPGLLAQHMGYFTWTVKRHLRPKVFAKLKLPVLEKYAHVLKVTVEQLKAIE
ncbi:MAG TPA: hypothetical protein EYN38_00130 [Flavobacteriales bacterium]|nr:hypothetical protein [Flavobacteriales bacterium]HIO71492.1 hypothetical protein [Flavobacteriales bacterium]